MAKQAKIYPKGRFVLRPLQQQSGKTNAVYMYYYWQRKQLRKAMDMFVDEKDWNENAEHGTGGFRASYGPDFQEKNKLLQKMLLDTDKKILEHMEKMPKYRIFVRFFYLFYRKKSYMTYFGKFRTSIIAEKSLSLRPN